MKKINETQYTTFNDLWNDKDLLTTDEKKRIELKVKIIEKLVEARDKKGLSQKYL
jgi:Trp operon repressor